MLSFEQVQEALTEMADRLPAVIFESLNGGILLLPEVKRHPQGQGDLYILGQYHFEPRGFGRYVTMYYGSFCRVCAGMKEEEQLQKLESVLHHELTHHLEHLAGDRSLEHRDAVQLADYHRRRGQKPK